MKKVDSRTLLELNILKNRLESGESALQCLHSMGVPLRGRREFLRQWQRLSDAMLSGKIPPAQAVGELVARLEDADRLQNLVQQKTLAPRLQAYLSTGIILLVLISSLAFFPENLRAGPGTIALSFALAGASLLCMRLILVGFLKQLVFLEWISFLRSLSLSLQCGLTLSAAIAENLPHPEVLRRWPRALADKISVAFLEDGECHYARHHDLWSLAVRAWSTLARNYREGLPQVELIGKLARLQEEEFKNRMILQSDRVGFWLLLPLFLLSVPAVLVLLFAPLLGALRTN